MPPRRYPFVLLVVMALLPTVATTAAAQCGDGTVDPGEQCDTGNVFAENCCSPLCEYDPPGTACANEGNACTIDTCDGAGTCEHNPFSPGDCSPAASGKSTFTVRRSADSPSVGTLVWKWVGSEAVAKEDFGTPGGGTALGLCIHDPVTTERFSTNFSGSCGDKPCYKHTTTGYTYRNPDDSLFRKSNISVKSGAAGKAKISIKGKGLHLGDLAGVALGAPLHVYMVRTDSTHCWEAVYSTIRNNDNGSTAKSD
jgi:cysteine-rich repeat protein